MKRILVFASVFFILLSTLVTTYFYLRIPVYFIKKVPISSLQNNQQIHKIDRAILENNDFFTKEYKEVFEIMDNEEKIISLQELYVDRCEVRQGDFYDFIEWSKKHPEQVKTTTNHPKKHQFRSLSDQHLIFGKDAVPANAVNFYDAAAYCLSTGGRLPSSQEWNAIAAGKENRLYPWGDDFIHSPWNRLNPMLNIAKKCPVSDDVNQLGVSSLGSSVSEWTMGEHPDGNPAMSGGNGRKRPYDIYALSAAKLQQNPLVRSSDIGFRCLYDTKIEKTPWMSTIASKKIPAGNYQIGFDNKAIAPKLLAQISPHNQDAIKSVFQTIKNESTQYYLSQFEITVSQYQHFLIDPFVTLKFYSNDKEPENIGYLPLNWHEQKRYPNRPVRGISWWAAYAFANWAKAELPSEEEWNQAVLGIDLNQFPWGETAHPGHAKTREQAEGAPDNIGENRQDKSEDMVFDLGGNVAEWTKSIDLQKQNFKMIVKGLSYDRPLFGVDSLVRYRNHISPHFQSNSIGLRLKFTE